MADARRAPLKDDTDISGARALIVEARFYDDIQDALLEGAVAELKAAGLPYDVITVPGSLEIPAAIAIALDAAEFSGQLRAIRESLGEGEQGAILDAHKLMADDPSLLEGARNLIREELLNAEWAVRRVTRKLKHMFDNIPDEYFRERKSDVDYVADRVVRNLMGQVVDVIDALNPASGH